MMDNLLLINPIVQSHLQGFNTALGLQVITKTIPHYFSGIGIRYQA
jgi:hypothetical protein